MLLFYAPILGVDLHTERGIEGVNYVFDTMLFAATVLLTAGENQQLEALLGSFRGWLVKTAFVAYAPPMLVSHGKVVEGKVVVEGPALSEGAEVVVLAREPGEPDFTLTAQQEAELEESIAEADRGDTVDGLELIKRLRG